MFLLSSCNVELYKMKVFSGGHIHCDMYDMIVTYCNHTSAKHDQLYIACSKLANFPIPALLLFLLLFTFLSRKWNFNHQHFLKPISGIDLGVIEDFTTPTFYTKQFSILKLIIVIFFPAFCKQSFWAIALTEMVFEKTVEDNFSRLSHTKYEVI